MSKYTQDGRPLVLETPLGKDVLLLASLHGIEGMSRPFHFSLEMLNEPANAVSFSKLLGQPVTATLRIPGAPVRYINGVVTRLVQGGQVHAAPGKTTLNRYRAEVTPKFGLLRKRIQNRIFQQMTVPAILAEVLGGLDVRFAIAGQYAPRDYCVQYRESDFAFASRLMEEEGICYFFEHTATSHTMVVTDVSTTFAALPEQSQLVYTTVENTPATDRRVRDWEKQQDVVSGQYSARDHAFELQDHDLEYQQTLSGNVTVGTVSHTLAVGPAKDLTIADYPGRYAQRFDGVSAEGQAQADALEKIFDDGPRTVRIRMEQEAVESLKIRGAGDYSHLTPGYTFTLERHFDGNGDYLFTEVEHTVSIGDSYLTGEGATPVYSNRFECIPKGLTYRPQRRTPEPSIAGTQSATVVGPTGQQVYCDKYGRVKVQFRWDRQGQHNLKSSCWLRVSQPWAGKGFGSIHLPRVGQEVVVAFEEGDPDRPIIIGSVYNSTNSPPFPLPEYASQTGFKSSTLNGDTSNFSGLGFDDSPGYEHVQLHSERHQTHSAEENLFVNVGQQHHVTIGQAHTRQVGGLPGINSYFIAAGPPKGSGSGGGETNNWTANQTGPYTWDFGVAGSWLAQDRSLVFGWQNTCVLGPGAASTQTVMMTNVRNYLNPVYVVHRLGCAGLKLFGMDPAGWSFPGSGFLSKMTTNLETADWKTNIGGSTKIQYGPSFEIRRGAEIQSIGTTVSPAAIAAASVYFGLVALSEVLPALAPATRYKSAGMHYATAVKVPMSMMLGVWKGFELKTQQAALLASTVAAGDLAVSFSESFPSFLDSNWLQVANVLDEVTTFTTPEGSAATNGKRCHTAESLYTIAAPQICLLSQPTLTTPHICLQSGSETSDGYVSLLASKSTMVTGGPSALVALTSTAGAGSIVVDCSAAGSITLQSGVEQAPNSLTLTPTGIAATTEGLLKLTATVGVLTLKSGEYTVAIDPEAGVTVTVGEATVVVSAELITLLSGGSSVALSAAGIVMKGASIAMQADGPVTINGAAVAVSEG
jgi:type VI secretion system secreted protein VgrG